MKNITVKKTGTYYNVKFIPNLPYIPMNVYDSLFQHDKNSAATFILAIKTFRNEIEIALKNNNFDYNSDAVVLRYLQVIDSYASGIDIRSKMKPAELAERFVLEYHNKFTEAFDFCTETLKFVEENKHDENVSYMKDWKRYDKHNELVRLWYMELKRIEMDDFEGNQLRKMANALKEMHELIDGAKNKANDKNS